MLHPNKTNYIQELSIKISMNCAIFVLYQNVTNPIAISLVTREVSPPLVGEVYFLQFHYSINNVINE